MKIAFVLSLLIASGAQAAVKVGNWASYETVAVNTKTKEVVVEESRNSIVELNEKDGLALVRYETLENGSVIQTDDVWTPVDDIMDNDAGDYIVAVCASDEIGGKHEKVQTKAGLFEACRVDQGGMSAWIAGVPFGGIKAAYTIEMEIDGKAISYDVTTILTGYGF